MTETTIKHLVIGGGGPTGLMLFGLLSELAEQKFWNPDNIESIYATSFGAIIAVCISLGYNWNDLEDYLVKRPWHKLVDFNLRGCVNAIYTKGLVSGDFCRQALSPLLTARDFDEDINLLDFYNKSHKEIHVYGVDTNSEILTVLDISYKTHPTLKLWEAITISAAVPILFPPYLFEDKCLLDGGILNNYPSRSFIEQRESEIDHVLGVKLNFNSNPENEKIEAETTIFEYMGMCVKKLIRMSYPEHARLPLQIECVSPDRDINGWLKILNHPDARQELIDTGRERAKSYLSEKQT